MFKPHIAFIFSFVLVYVWLGVYGALLLCVDCDSGDCNECLCDECTGSPQYQGKWHTWTHPFLLNALEFYNYYALFLLIVFKAMFLLDRTPSSVLVIPQTPLSLGKMITTLKMMLCLKSGLEN